MDKKCSQCHEKKKVTEFYKQQQRGNKGQLWHYYDSMCKACRLEYSFERRKLVKKQAVEYLGGKCQKCGLVDNPVVYDFHHIDPKRKDFTIGKQHLTFERLKPELDKCMLVCSNCHRKIHSVL